jgi:hypothetical protein
MYRTWLKEENHTELYEENSEGKAQFGEMKNTFF